MTEKTIYVSFTGKEFTDKDECAAYESEMNDLMTTGMSYVRKIKSFCESRIEESCDSTCPFYCDADDLCIFGNEPFDWKLPKCE